MRSFINVIAKTDIVCVIANALVVAKRNVVKLPHTLRELHLEMRRLHAWLGYLPFTYGTMQPIPAAAPKAGAAAAASRRDSRVTCAACRSSRLG